MDIPDLHPWNVTPEEAIKIQKCLKDRVILKKIDGKIKYISGLDVSYAKGGNTVWAGVVVLDFPSLEKIEEDGLKRRFLFLTSPVF